MGPGKIRRSVRAGKGSGTGITARILMRRAQETKQMKGVGSNGGNR